MPTDHVLTSQITQQWDVDLNSQDDELSGPAREFCGFDFKPTLSRDRAGKLMFFKLVCATRPEHGDPLYRSMPTCLQYQATLVGGDQRCGGSIRVARSADLSPLQMAIAAGSRRGRHCQSIALANVCSW